ncbi:MAG: TetR/AcrR family transcriptional regulator [Candidatus Aminicenantales bacterium]
MSPRETTFDKPAVLAAAIKIVGENGWEKLTARAVADELKASVAPVYSTFGSMEALEREILHEARRRLYESTMVAYTDDAFLNIGVGMVVFARDEGPLFTALFHTRHSHPDIVEAVFASILQRMKADAMLRLLPDASLERLLDNIGAYTLGLAASIVYGRDADPSTASIIGHLKNAGNMMIFGEVSGIADCESPDNEREWERIVREKNIVLPWPPHQEGKTTLSESRVENKKKEKR